jgi:hypothetical protein
MQNVGIKSTDGFLYVGAKYDFSDGFFNTVAVALDNSKDIPDIALANGNVLAILLERDGTHVQVGKPVDNDHKVPIIDFHSDTVAIVNESAVTITRFSVEDFIRRYKH